MLRQHARRCRRVAQGGEVGRSDEQISPAQIGSGDDTVGNPHRTQISQFLFSSFGSFILLLKFDKQLPVEQFKAAASQSAVPFPTSYYFY